MCTSAALLKCTQSDTKLPRIMPFERNPRFTGREPELSRLQELLGQESKEYTSRTAIYGLGGVGKTQLAIELVYRTIENHKGCLVFWIPATDSESLYHAYVDVAQQLNIPGCNEKDVDVRRLVQQHLSQNSTTQWLIVFDNADDIEMWTGTPDHPNHSTRLIDCLPKSKQGSIVFTTRDRKAAVKLAQQQNMMEVRELDTNLAKRLLQKSLVHCDVTDSDGDSDVLLEKLANLPLAIIQASAYINENGITIPEYLSLFDEQETDIVELLSEDFEDSGRYSSIKNPVATTWLISFERILQHDQLAADYLSFMACIEPKDIPLSLLPAGPSRKKEIDALGTLDAYSFITSRPRERSLDLHRLVHLTTRNWLKKRGLMNDWLARSLAQLILAFPKIKHENRVVWREYLAHALYLLSIDDVEKYSVDWSKLAWKVGQCLSYDGRYKDAGELYLRTLETRKKALGEEHKDTLNTMSELATIHRHQGRLEDAEQLGLQVIEKMKAVLGEEHTDTLTSINNLALVYTLQKRWEEAEKLHLRVLEIRKRTLGEEHSLTLSSKHNLALTYSKQRRLEEAEKLDLHVVEIRKRVLGGDHPDTLLSLNNLALTYKSQGRYEEAERLQVLDMRTRILGETHPDTLMSMNNLAVMRHNQGRDKEAIELMERCVNLRKDKLGLHHPYTKNSIRWLEIWRGA
jgi:tetratricopeptide (TPR) repeat protein